MNIAAPPVAVLIPGIMLRTGTQSATRLDIEKMGLWVTDLLSDAQLAAAAERYNASIPQNKQFLVPITTLRMVWMNHFNKCIRMPAGGALAGGSMQTGFEIELITHSAAHALMEGWQNRQEMAHGGLSWEVRSLLPTRPTPSISNQRAPVMPAVGPHPRPGGCAHLLLARLLALRGF